MNSVYCGTKLQIVLMIALIGSPVITLQYAVTSKERKFGPNYCPDVLGWQENSDELPDSLRELKLHIILFYKQKNSEPFDSSLLNDKQLTELVNKTDAHNAKKGVDRAYSGGITVLEEYSQEEKDCIEKWLNLYESEHSSRVD